MEPVLRFKSFSSGSCGNCYFLGLEEEGEITAAVLIDAGVSLRRLKRELAAEGLGLDSFSAVLVTHDHLDHIRALGSYCKHLGKPVYATSELLYALSHHTFTLDYIGAVKRPLADEGWTDIVPGKIAVRYFVVPHDATQTVGYAVRIGGRNFVIMTDIGAMTDQALAYARGADTVVIESNYDLEMLLKGPYTYDLKMRITRGSGHLSNDQCASAIRSFLHPGLRHIFLCHLSENNNTPDLALAASRAALADAAAPAPTLRALPRRTPSQLFRL
ncbi:MAG: MBL fold metallo-hydrolase [Bacteroidales bacterium]|nr:MBL fold metallo-hydrolase [Bacteroidales bacterium]MBP5634887.1 MBL fold metallo-hydrolase [Bacteroidales bacterium]